MTLPSISAPSYFLELPSTKQKIKFRPFLVKEEKILSIALMTDDKDTIMNAIGEIVTNCTFGKVDITKIPSFDFEYIFLQLRSKSKGNIVNLKLVCKNMVDDKHCNTDNEFEVDLDKVSVQFKPNHSKNIQITDNILVKMRYPTFADNILMEELFKDNKISEIYLKLADYIECVVENDTVFDNFTNEEMAAWLEELSGKQFEKIEKFFEDIPKIKHTITVKCKKCGHTEEISLEGLLSFLALS